MLTADLEFSLGKGACVSSFQQCPRTHVEERGVCRSSWDTQVSIFGKQQFLRVISSANTHKLMISFLGHFLCIHDVSRIGADIRQIIQY